MRPGIRGEIRFVDSPRQEAVVIALAVDDGRELGRTRVPADRPFYDLPLAENVSVSIVCLLTGSGRVISRAAMAPVDLDVPETDPKGRVQ